MSAVAYPVSWLRSRTAPISSRHVAGEIGWVRLRALDILKGVIRTPMSGGKVDYDQVPVGSSIWVTVTEESSPMHGRPILITKRPDGQFALEGGSGVRHWHDDADGERSRRVAARRHLVLGVGKLKPSRIDQQTVEKVRERDALRGKLAEQRAEKRQLVQQAASATRKAVGLSEDAKLTKNQRAIFHAQAADLFRQVGAGDKANRYALDMGVQLAQLKQRATAAHTMRRIQSAAKMLSGPLLSFTDDPEEQAAEARANPIEATSAHAEAAVWEVNATAMADAIMRQESALGRPLTQSEAEVVLQQEGDRQLQASLAPPEPGEMGDPQATPLTPEQQATGQPELQAHPDDAPPPGDDLAALASFGAQAAAAGRDPSDPSSLDREPPPPPPVMLPLVQLPEWSIDQKAQAAKVVETLRQEMEVRGAITKTQGELDRYKGLRLVTPSQVDRQMIDAQDIPLPEFERLLKHYANAHRLAQPGAFYGALTDHWNDSLSYADGIAGYAESGAIGAVTGILGQSDVLDERLDVAKLVKVLGIEGAAYAVATDIIAQNHKNPARIRAIIEALTDYNASNQGVTEERALRRHDELKHTEKLITDMMESRELGGSPKGLRTASSTQIKGLAERASAEGTRLLAENIVQQRANLGTALGSMQMAATLLHALESTTKRVSQKEPEAQIVTLYYGDNEDFRNEALNKLAVGQGALTPGKDPELGHYLKIDTMRLGKFVGRVKAERQRDMLWQKLKESNQGVKNVDGQDVVPDYKVPFFKDSFTDADGEEKPIVMRKNQRNDIEWLKRSGGGVITRTTGAGKTNTTLGFMAWKIHENPKYHGVAVVPNGRGEQWLTEANNFTNLNVVHIPDNASNEAVQQHIHNFNSLDNGVLIMGHRKAAQQSQWLHGLYEAGHLHGMAIDEPQEMQGQNLAARLTASGQEVMKVGSKLEGNRRTPDPAFNRIALTATPAKSRPVQAYDLVNWSNPGALGPRTKFHAAYGGFAEGTSAADDAMANMIGKEIAPFVSGDEEVTHPFQLNVKQHLVNRSPQQVERQKSIERDAPREVRRLADARYTELVEKGRDPMDARKQANAEARARLGAHHRENLDSGETDDSGRLVDPAQAAKGNAKIQEFLKEVKRAKPNEKHVVFVEGAAQRAAVTQALRDAGYPPGAIKNLAEKPGPKETDARKRQWKLGGANTPFLLIDKDSASGHNLQEGDHLHVLAAPGDAATLLQAQGRVARGNKRTDTTIHSYRTHDSPFESREWEKIERGMKLMAATSPGLARNFLDKTTKAREKAIQALGPRTAPEAQVAKSVWLRLR